MKYSFPAIFSVDKEDPKLINVFIPDIPGAVTFGQDLENARYMAKDLLVALSEEVKIATASSLQQTKQNFPDKIVEMVEVEI